MDRPCPRADTNKREAQERKPIAPEGHTLTAGVKGRRVQLGRLATADAGRGKARGQYKTTGGPTMAALRMILGRRPAIFQVKNGRTHAPRP
jgi:hypothetical protein